MRATPSQTVGPFLSIGLDWGADGADADGTRISGRVLDGAGDPVPDRPHFCDAASKISTTPSTIGSPCPSRS